MTVIGRSSIHVLVSEGWNDDEELLEHHVEHPSECDTCDDFCYLDEDIIDIDYVREQYLRTRGRYGFYAVYTQDYWGEQDVHIEQCDIPANMHTVREKMADQLALFGIKATTFGGANLLDNLEAIVRAEVVDKAWITNLEAEWAAAAVRFDNEVANQDSLAGEHNGQH